MRNISALLGSKPRVIALMLGAVISVSPLITGCVQAEAVKTTTTKEYSVSPALTYQRLEKMPDGNFRKSFVDEGSQFINNLNTVAVDNGKPALIRGGGFTRAGIDWLVKEAGVRTFIDLRGKFPDDGTSQMIVHSDAVRNQFKARNEEDKLRNLSPEKTEAYINQLQQQLKVPLLYMHLEATDPKVTQYLNTANAEKPVAMFCQYGVNRSGTAWAMYAADKGWPAERSYELFGVSNGKGGIKNKRDIDYGYRVYEARVASKAKK